PVAVPSGAGRARATTLPALWPPGLGRGRGGFLSLNSSRRMLSLRVSYAAARRAAPLRAPPADGRGWRRRPSLAPWASRPPRPRVGATTTRTRCPAAPPRGTPIRFLGTAVPRAPGWRAGACVSLDHAPQTDRPAGGRPAAPRTSGCYLIASN